MKIKQSEIDNIRKWFSKMKSLDDLAFLLTKSKKILYKKKVTFVNQSKINYHANPKNNKNRYYSFAIKKKSGGFRIINSPNEGLKKILRVLNFVLQVMYEPHKSATGFVQGKSVVDNARVHIGQIYVYNIDLKDFFHSFDRNRVKRVFMQAPFNLKGDKEPIAFVLASLCTHPLEIDGELKTVLPQGSPTSPTITNIICSQLDRRLSGLANRFGAKYTRYADDITFSSMTSIFKKDEFLDELHRIIRDDNKLIFPNKTITIGSELKINKSKTRLQKNVYRQEVTGLIVNEKVNVPRRYVKKIRMYLYYWERYGYAKASQIFRKYYSKDKTNIKSYNLDMSKVLDGKLEYLKMVKGDTDTTYITLKKRYDKLLEKSYPIDKVLNIWENEGIEKAIEYYYKISKNLKEFSYLEKNSPIIKDLESSLWSIINAKSPDMTNQAPPFPASHFEFLRQLQTIEENDVDEAENSTDFSDDLPF